MTTRSQEFESLATGAGGHEAGVAELMEFYEKVEGIYAEASAFLTEDKETHISDTTNIVRPDAYLGRSPK